jgi:hypothetical protein
MVKAGGGVIGNRHDHALTLRRTFVVQERSDRHRRKRVMAVAPVNHETSLRMKNGKI